MHSRFQPIIVSVIACVALLLAPIGVVSGGFLSLSDSEMQRESDALNSMFQVSTAPEDGEDDQNEEDGIVDDDNDDSNGNIEDDDPITGLPGEGASEGGSGEREVGGDPSQVPEPGMLLLFGLGMLSLYLVIARRRKA